MDDAAKDNSPPQHVAIIMDGNGRWAEARRLPRRLGHRQGVEAVRATVRAAGDLGVRYLTLYSFSSENWNRPPEEVSDLMGLLREFVRRNLDELAANGVKIRIIGNRENLADDIVSIIRSAESRTANNTKLTLIIAFNYGSRNEILEAARSFAKDVAAGATNADDLTFDLFKGYLATAEFPDPDLLIRTSGEMRLSNFLLWQSAYTELVFLDILWPDFNKSDLEYAVDQYHKRERRFGARTPKEAVR
jgi:undecaprenyl diphosphate synthase